MKKEIKVQISDELKDDLEANRNQEMTVISAEVKPQSIVATLEFVE